MYEIYHLYYCVINKSNSVAISMAGQGNITDSHVKWKVKKKISNDLSPIIHNGLLYVVNDRGNLSCLKASTGVIIWQNRLNGKYGASPIVSDDRIYLFSKKGLCTVLKAGEAFPILAENQLGEGFWASPAVSDLGMECPCTKKLER